MGKRALLLGLVVTALAIPAPAQAEVRAETAALQIALSARGLYGGPLDGLAGPATLEALRTFQKRAGLPQTAKLDRRTRLSFKKLGKPVAGSRVVSRRMMGWDVSVLEFQLARRGFDPGAIDGRFNRDTRAAVRGFQRYARLGVDGAAGHATFKALRRSPLARSPIALSWPLRRPVVERFGLDGRHLRTGVLLAAPYGSPIAAAADGNVVEAGFRPGGLGLAVTIEHARGVRTVYGHLARVDVRVGQKVVRGALVGLVGWTGQTRKPRLHLEVRVRGAAVDPLRVLR